MGGPDPKTILRDNAGALESRRNRKTKTVITLYDSVEAGLGEGPDCKYTTLCEDHGYLVSHKTRQDAKSAMAWPYWCERCHAIMHGDTSNETDIPA